jgi:hypothetical protein
MKCPVVKRYLYRLENPDRPCQAVRDHLSHCGGCRKAQEGLLQLENQVRLLPIPESDAKLPFLSQFRVGTIGHAPATDRHWLPWQVRDRARRKLALAASLAAGIVLFAIGWFIFQHANRSAPVVNTPTVAVIKRQHLQDQLKVALEDAHSYSERLQVYEEQLKLLNVEGVAKESTDEELKGIVAFYQEDFLKDLVTEAKGVPIGHRGELLRPIMERLDLTAQLADRNAEYHDGLKAKQLRAFAVSARKSVDDLQLVIDGA